ncbi:tetratricopeptide repeat protein [Endozoicomonas lisbonensis]|uniref:tetratricopeptide repeat protein n=1 Tax=Endozoicomonas lisbonensis TaxID=3120522 RepID=UPI00339991D6
MKSQTVHNLALIPFAIGLSWLSVKNKPCNKNKKLYPVIFPDCDSAPKALELNKNAVVTGLSEPFQVMSLIIQPESGSQNLMARLPDVALISNGHSASDLLLLVDRQSPFCNREDAALTQLQHNWLNLKAVSSSGRQHSDKSHRQDRDLPDKPELLVGINEEGVVVFIIVEIDERGKSHVKQLKTNVLVTDPHAQDFIQRLVEYQNVAITPELSRRLNQKWPITSHGKNDNYYPGSGSEEKTHTVTSLQPVRPLLSTGDSGLMSGTASVIQSPADRGRSSRFRYDEEYYESNTEDWRASQPSGSLTAHESFNNIDRYIDHINELLGDLRLKVLLPEILESLKAEVDFTGGDARQQLTFRRHMNFIQKVVDADTEEEIKQLLDIELKELQKRHQHITHLEHFWWWAVSIFEQSGLDWVAEEFMRKLLGLWPDNSDLGGALVWHLIHRDKVKSAKNLVEKWERKQRFSSESIDWIKKMFSKNSIRRIKSTAYSNFKPFSKIVRGQTTVNLSDPGGR